jgi:AraC-like DNA-binding protein/tetratricopeptide (TPR) repeat protein
LRPREIISGAFLMSEKIGNFMCIKNIVSSCIKAKMNNANHNDLQFINRLTAIIEANLQNDQFGASELARALNVSRSTLHRKVKESTKLSISQFICQLRLKKALTLLRETSLTISETAYECGFNSVTYFTKCFHDYYGYSPGKSAAHKEQEQVVQNSAQVKTVRWEKWLKPAAGIFIFALIIFLISESAYFGLTDSGIEEKPKTIAILPMKFEGSDSMRLMAGGLTEAILNSLMEIENLNIRPKTSVEQYKETIKPLKVIAKELNVAYVIEMSGYQKGNNIHFQVNIADAGSNAYLWRKSYPVNINEESSLGLQNRIAGDIASKMKIQLSPLEKEKLKEQLTDNPVARNRYMQGLSHGDISNRIGSLGRWPEVIEEVTKAKNNFREAIGLDSAFTEAYVMLAHTYISCIDGLDPSKRNQYLDSGLVMAEKAISLCNSNLKENELRVALSLKSDYMLIKKGDIKESRRIFEESLKYRAKSSSENYQGMFAKFCRFEDYYEAIAAFYKYRELKPPEEIIPSWMYNNFCRVLFKTGFPDIAEKYLREALATNLDSLGFYLNMCSGNLFFGTFEHGISYANKALKFKPNPFEMASIYNRALCYVLQGQYDSAFEEINTYNLDTDPRLKSAKGYIYNMKGQSDLANRNFQEVAAFLEKAISSNHPDAALNYSHLYLAMNYSALGEKEKALAYLKEVKNKNTIPRWIIVYLQHEPFFDSICNEPEFIKLVKEFEGKYQKEHDRIAGLLREEGEI